MMNIDRNRYYSTAMEIINCLGQNHDNVFFNVIVYTVYSIQKHLNSKQLLKSFRYWSLQCLSIISLLNLFDSGFNINAIKLCEKYSIIKSYIIKYE